jgi:fatty acid desaturase
MSFQVSPSVDNTPDQRQQPTLRRIDEKTKFKISLAIFGSVNALLLVIWAAVTVVGVNVHGQLWPWPVVMGVWGVFVATQGYTAYRGKG